MPITCGPLVISDFGAARVGKPFEKHTGDVMPGVYRAPEILLGMESDYKIDIWYVGSRRVVCLLTARGNWTATTEIPDQALETCVTRLRGKDKELLIALVRKILRWLPEERPSAEDLFNDEFLNQYNFAEKTCTEGDEH
ncbi:hypothetical protein R6Q59_010169 [Mikania micrantha]